MTAHSTDFVFQLGVLLIGVACLVGNVLVFLTLISVIRILRGSPARSTGDSTRPTRIAR